MFWLDFYYLMLGCAALYFVIFTVDARPFSMAADWLTACWEWIYRHSGAERLDDWLDERR